MKPKTRSQINNLMVRKGDNENRPEQKNLVDLLHLLDIKCKIETEKKIWNLKSIAGIRPTKPPPKIDVYMETANQKICFRLNGEYHRNSSRKLRMRIRR